MQTKIYLNKKLNSHYLQQVVYLYKKCHWNSVHSKSARLETSEKRTERKYPTKLVSVLTYLQHQFHRTLTDF